MTPRKNKNDAEILIAEDSPTQAEQLKHLLEQHGYAVTVSANGREALTAARRRRPGLILADVLMPELDGYGLCRAVKSDAALKDVPVILVTALSDPQDVIRGLECGADNFIRKPYDERYLLSRIDYLRMNRELRRGQKMQLGVEIELGGERHFITSERQQILDLLISTYEQAVHINEQLRAREKDLAHSNQVLNGLYRMAEGLNRANSEQAVAELALERALEVPGIQAGWIFLRDGDDDFRLAATRNLPPALAAPGAFEGDCLCRRRLASGEFGAVTNIVECERLKTPAGDTHGLRYHASVPLWIGSRALGVMNLFGPGEGLFDEKEAQILTSVGNQVAVALERARLHERLEQLVAQRTAALRASEARMRAIVEAEPECVKILDPEHRIVQMNAAGLAMIEADDLGQVRAHPAEELVVPEQRAAYRTFLDGVQHGCAGTFEFEIVGLKGTHRWLDTHAVPLPNGHDGPPQVLAITRDVTERRAQRARIERLNRVYALLSGINTAIVRFRDRRELFAEACRVAVEHGRFRMAWIGWVEADGRRVTPVEVAGVEDGYLLEIGLLSPDQQLEAYPLLAQALREQVPVVCNDIAGDERMRAWHDQALKRGYRSMTVLPLVLEARAVGVFTLYASEPGCFDEQEMRLLAEMAGDIAFGLDHIRKEERLNYLAYYDVLTGLPNRELFFDRVDQLVRAARGDEKIAFVAVDLERLSQINNTFGRQAGDALLRLFARRLGETLGERGVHARISADYFGVAIGDVRGEADVAHALEQRVMRALNQPFTVENNELRLSAKAGIAVFPADGADAETLFKNAEAALKRAKRSGDKYLFYTPELNARVAERLTLETKLRRALERDQFVLHYQPKVDLRDGRVSGVEALIRWNDPDSGLVPPLKFIPILEETGMIFEAGRWALERAMRDYQRWLANGLAAPRIAVNVSSIQLRQKDFVAVVERALRDVSGAAAGLELEITESLVMQDIEANIRKLNAVREMGVEVAVDDFGTGYSSLSYIARLPVNTLKIDRTFITNMTAKPDDLSIVSTIISLAHSLNLGVVAEGVETEEQQKLLRLLKCDEFQGYLFSPAVPAEQIDRFLRGSGGAPG